MAYIREDIYYCSGCGQFFDELTDKRLEISYAEMPAEFAIQVMSDRQMSRGFCHPRWRNRKPRKTGRGFTPN
jgi:hypothetical protein